MTGNTDIIIRMYVWMIRSIASDRGIDINEAGFFNGHGELQIFLDTDDRGPFLGLSENDIEAYATASTNPELWVLRALAAKRLGQKVPRTDWLYYQFV